MKAPLRDYFDRYYNAVDRLNQDYHMFFTLRNLPTAISMALHSACFYFLNTVHAVWEEHRVFHNFHQKKQSKSAANSVQDDSIPKFIVECATPIVERRAQENDTRSRVKD